MGAVTKFFDTFEAALAKANILRSKRLGDGILFFSCEIEPGDWLDATERLLAPAIRRYCLDIADVFPFEYSLVVGYGEFYLLSASDPIGIAIDDLFLVERHGDLNKTLVSSELCRRAPRRYANRFLERRTESIGYLDGLSVPYFELLPHEI